MALQKPMVVADGMIRASSVRVCVPVCLAVCNVACFRTVRMHAMRWCVHVCLKSCEGAHMSRKIMALVVSCVERGHTHLCLEQCAVRGSAAMISGCATPQNHFFGRVLPDRTR